MLVLGMLPIVLSFAVLAAHFLRDGNVAMVAVSLFLPVLLFIPRRAVARALQAALVLASLEWVRTMAAIVQDRMAAGVPYTRTAIILSAVALLTLASALAFHTRRMRRRYGLERRP